MLLAIRKRITVIRNDMEEFIFDSEVYRKFISDIPNQVFGIDSEVPNEFYQVCRTVIRKAFQYSESPFGISESQMPSHLPGISK